MNIPAQDIGSLAHELGGLDLSAGGNDLGLTGTLGLRSHGQAILELLGEDDILDKHALDIHTPARSRLLNNSADIGSNLLTALNDILQVPRADNMAQGGLRALDQRLADVGDAKGGLVRRGDAVVDDRRQLQAHVVARHADLLGHLDNLDLDVDLDQRLAQRVDAHEAGVDGAAEAAEAGDQADVALLDGLVSVVAGIVSRCSVGFLELMFFSRRVGVM